MRKLILAGLVALAGCGGPEVWEAEPYKATIPDTVSIAIRSVWVGNTLVVIKDPGLAAEYDANPGEMALRFAHVLTKSVEYWGAPYNLLDGWVVEYVPKSEILADNTSVRGATYFEAKVMRVITYDPKCPETSVVPHEVLHIALDIGGDGDRAHKSDLWLKVEFAWRSVVAESPSNYCADEYRFAGWFWRWDG